MKTKASSKKGYTAEDMKVVSENHEWTDKDFEKARRGRDALPKRFFDELEARRTRGLRTVSKSQMQKCKVTGESDMAEVMDHPEWTDEDFRNARPFGEVFPELAANIRKARGAQKAPTKKLVSLRLDPDVLEKLRATGPGWQSRANAALRKAVGLK